MLRGHAIAVSVAIQLHVVRGAPSDAHGPVPHRGGLREPLGNRRAVAQKTRVVSDVDGIDLRRPYVVEVLRHDGAQHGPRPQRGPGPGAFPGAGEHARDAVYVRRRQEFARERHVFVLQGGGKQGVKVVIGVFGLG